MPFNAPIHFYPGGRRLECAAGSRVDLDGDVYQNGVAITLPVAAADVTLAFGTASPLALTTATAGKRAKRVIVKVNTAFDGAPSLTVGDAGSNNRLMEASAVDLTTEGVYIVEPYHLYAASTAINAYYTAGGAAAGSATIIVEF